MMKVGVIGCGNIADIYFKNSKQFFNNFEIDACADINEEASKIFAKKYNVRQLSVEDILADKEIEFIIEDNKFKHGKFLPGMKIPIMSKSVIKGNVDCVIVLAWNFIDEIKKKNSDLTHKFISIKDLEI